MYINVCYVYIYLRFGHHCVLPTPKLTSAWCATHIFTLPLRSAFAGTYIYVCKIKHSFVNINLRVLNTNKKYFQIQNVKNIDVSVSVKKLKTLNKKFEILRENAINHSSYKQKLLFLAQDIWTSSIMITCTYKYSCR